MRFHGCPTAPTDLTLTADAWFTTDARQASRNFALDHLVVIAADEDVVPAGVPMRVVGSRSMARHGASALDTEVTAHLMAFDNDDLDVEQTLSRAMLMVNLGLAQAEAPEIDARFSGALA